MADDVTVAVEVARLIVMDKSLVAVLGVGDLLSVTLAVKLDVPGVVGVLEIVFPLRLNPSGRLPVIIDQM